MPRLNQRLEVALETRGSAQYFSRLIEETSDVLRLSQPEMEGRLLDLREGDQIRVWFTQAGGYWCLNSKVIHIWKKSGETIIDVDRTGSVRRAQRRNHVRVDVSLLLHAQSVSEDAPAERISGVTRNISGGGVSFRSKEAFEDGGTIALTFYLPQQGGEIVSRARVIHCQPDPEKEGHFVIACMFQRMAISDRERIIRFLFFRQRELAGRRKVMAR
jgi:c-di-GMP-binding flagellar brake protein YcgR